MIVYHYLSGGNKKAVFNSLLQHVFRFAAFEKEVTVYCNTDESGYEKGTAPVNVSFPPRNSYFSLVRRIIQSNDPYMLVCGWLDVFILLPVILFARKTFIIWVQGAAAEEKFLKTGSQFLFRLYSWCEGFALARCSRFIFVSSTMQNYFEQRYHSSYQGRSIIVPCTSDLAYDGSQKIMNSFTYVGGTSGWQKIEPALKLFNDYAKQVADATLYLVSGDISTLNELKKKHISPEVAGRVFISTIASRKEMQTHMSKMQYGFLLRDNHIVNEVSSPIKLAEYLSCAVFPIISPGLVSYADRLHKMESAFVAAEESSLSELKDQTIDLLKLLTTYETIFGETKLASQYGFHQGLITKIK